MNLLRQYCLPVACTLFLGACADDKQEQPTSRGDPSIQPVELIFTEDGRPDPSVLADEQLFRRDNREEPETLDPHLAEGVPAAHILRDLFEGLTAESPDGRVVPGAAIRWNISRDGKTYTFYLRRDALWSNGDPVTAEDFVYGLRRSANPVTASTHAQVLLPIANAAEVLAGKLPLSELGVVALEEFTLQISLNGPTPYFLGLLNHSSTYPVHRASVLQHGNAFSRPGNLVSNGAYELEDWQIHSRIELVKNENYWDAENVILEKVIYYPYEDQSAAVKRFRQGDLHWTYDVPNNQFNWLKKNYANELVISPWLGSYFFGFNLWREPFTENPDLRLALALALDRDLLTEKVTQYGEQPSYTLVPPGITDYFSPLPEWAEWTQAEREQEARRLYANAGYSEERPLRFEIRYDTSENNKKMALAVASLWKQVLGVQASLVNEESKVFLQSKEQKILTQVFRAGWIGDYADAYSFLELFRSGHGRNDYGYSNPLYDSLLDEITSERIPSRRRRLMFEAERVLLSELPFIPLYSYVTKRLVDPRLQGWQSNVMDHHYSKDMFLLKTVSEMEASIDAQQDEPGPGAEPGPIGMEGEATDVSPAEAVNGPEQVEPGEGQETGSTGNEAAEIDGQETVEGPVTEQGQGPDSSLEDSRDGNVSRLP